MVVPQDGLMTIAIYSSYNSLLKQDDSTYTCRLGQLSSPVVEHHEVYPLNVNFDAPMQIMPGALMKEQGLNWFHYADKGANNTVILFQIPIP